jgi:hypothetical protein
MVPEDIEVTVRVTMVSVILPVNTADVGAPIKA